MFLSSEKLQNHGNEGKERRKRKREEKERRRRKKKTMVLLLVFIIATLEIIFGRKLLFDAKGPFGDNVIKNSARYT